MIIWTMLDIDTLNFIISGIYIYIYERMIPIQTDS